MAVSPLEERYATEMNSIFGEESRYAAWLKVEAALAWAHARLGTISAHDAVVIEKHADLKHVKLERIKEIEAQIDHDLMALVKALAEQCGKAGGSVHLGATSYDIEDTANGLIFGDALDLIGARLNALLDVLVELAKKHKSMVCVGRTHGQHAVPTTYGLKFALWASEVASHRERLAAAREKVAVGKMSGAVGTMATFGEHGMKVQELVMKRLGLKAARVTNQVVQREAHAEMMFLLAVISATLEKIAKEIRNLQRTEISEIAEPVRQKQVGSSTMPQKRNPHKSERICSLARVVRANVHVALENVSLEHERDLTNSANERIVIPDSFILTDYMMKQMIGILAGLEFFPENIDRNLRLTKGAVLAERLMIALAEKGMSRQDAHELLREASAKAAREKRSLRDELMWDQRILKHLSRGELEKLFDEKTYIGQAEKIVETFLKELKR